MKKQKRSETPLSLVNDGALEIIPIGTGSMLAKRHFNTNYLIIKGNTHILFDCGRTAPEALTALGVQLTDIRAIMPSHAHDDHIGGVGTLAIANRYVGQMTMAHPKLTLLAPAPVAHAFWNEAWKGNLSHNEWVVEEKRELRLHDWFNVVTPEMVSHEWRETSFIDYGDIHVRTFCTMHTPSTAESWRDSTWSIGILIDNRVFISGDTRFDEELLDTYAPQAEVMFHDVAFWNDPVHASLASLRTRPTEEKQKMHLIHYGDTFAAEDVSEFAGFAEQGTRYIFE